MYIYIKSYKKKQLTDRSSETGSRGRGRGFAGKRGSRRGSRGRGEADGAAEGRRRRRSGSAEDLHRERERGKERDACEERQK